MVVVGWRRFHIECPSSVCLSTSSSAVALRCVVLRLPVRLSVRPLVVVQILALCYDLEKDINGTAHLRRQPYHELHTSDTTGKTLFVCKRSQRQPPPPKATIESTVNAIRDVLVAQYGLTDEVLSLIHI